MDSDPSRDDPRIASRRLPARLQAPWVLALLALLAGLLITAGLVAWQHQRTRDERGRQLAALADGEFTMLQARLQEYDLALRAVQAAFLSQALDATSFERTYRFWISSDACGPAGTGVFRASRLARRHRLSHAVRAPAGRQ